MADAGGYSFASQPKSVGVSRGKTSVGKAGYRNAQQWGAGSEADGANARNIMFDKRVVRGNTYAAQVVNSTAHFEMERYREEQEKKGKKRELMEKRREHQASQQLQTPGPVPGRKHADVQTDNYLEELTDKVAEKTVESQTEPFMDRPIEPLFMPAKIGVDTETQVEVGELFDFDLEVEPLLEVLVGKTLEHALMEVLEEEEIAAIRAHQAEYEQQRNAELAEVQRLEAEAIRKAEEKARRVEQEKARIEREAQVRQKVEARSFAKDYLSELHDSVFDKLLEQGHFFDPLEKEVGETFMPWLLDSVSAQVDQVALARRLTDGLVQKALDDAAAALAKRRAEVAAEKARLAEEARLAAEAEEARLAAEAKAAEDEEEEGKEE